jgi:uncharacterized RDD family membrane protein YckC
MNPQRPDLARDENGGDADDDGDDAFALSLLPRRAGAYLLDVLLLAAALGVFHAALFQFVHGGERPEFTRNGWLLEAYALLTISLPVWLYFAFTESGPRQASLGKRWLGIRVSGLDGERLDFKTALLRTFVKLLPWELTHVAIFCPIPLWDAPNDALMRPLFMLSTFLVGSWFVTAILTKHQQGPHDLLMKTVVVPVPPLTT